MLSSGFSHEAIFSISILAYNMGGKNARDYLKNHRANDWKYVKEVSALKSRLEKGELIHESSGVES
jgi:hypothetical protein